MSDPHPAITQFQQDAASSIQGMAASTELRQKSLDWMECAAPHRYTYLFSWLGRPIIQFPQDMVALQEIVWVTKPDLIIETGIAHGGSLILSASLLAQLDICEHIEAATTFDPRMSKRKVLGIDIDIRPHNRAAIESHPMASRIQMIQGSSISPEVIRQVQDIASDYQRILVILDSNHTHEHVLAELEAYAPLTSVGSYCVVFDTAIEDTPNVTFQDRPWGVGNNPKTAVRAYLNSGSGSKFEIDADIHNKLQITVAPDGYLKRVG